MPTIIDSMRDTLDINQDRRVVDIMDKIHLLEPDKAPLTVLLSKLRRVKAINPVYKHLEDVLFPRTDRVNNGAGYSASALAITVDNGSYFKANDIVEVTRTGEIMSVDSVASNVVTFTRSWGATAAAAMVDNDELLILGNANAEGAGKPVIKTTQTATLTNHTEIFRNPFGATRTETQSDLYGGADRNYLRNKNLIEHLVDIERSFWFGEMASGAETNRRTTKGFFAHVTTNVTALGTGGLTETTFNDWLRTAFRYGNRTKFLFGSPLTIQKISGFALSSLQVVPTDKTFGIHITKYISPHGVVNIINNFIFEGDTYDEYAALVDLENVGMKVMQPTTLRTNIQANDIDGWEDEYLTEAGMLVRQEKTHAVLTNVGGSAVT